jgi:hypothetical protein
VKASIKRDGPGEWWWTVGDEEGAIVGGIAPDWPRALDDAQRELQVLGQVDDVLPLTVRPREGIVLRGPVTPGDATVPPGDRLYHRDGPTFHELIRSRVPAWRRWLGLP